MKTYLLTRPACLVLCLLLALLLGWIFCKLTCFEQSTLFRYLCIRLDQDCHLRVISQSFLSHFSVISQSFLSHFLSHFSLNYQKLKKCIMQYHSISFMYCKYHSLLFDLIQSNLYIKNYHSSLFMVAFNHNE